MGNWKWPSIFFNSLLQLVCPTPRRAKLSWAEQKRELGKESIIVEHNSKHRSASVVASEALAASVRSSATIFLFNFVFFLFQLLHKSTYWTNCQITIVGRRARTDTTSSSSQLPPNIDHSSWPYCDYLRPNSINCTIFVSSMSGRSSNNIATFLPFLPLLASQ